MSDGPFHRLEFEPNPACLALVDENTRQLLLDLAAAHAEFANRKYRELHQPVSEGMGFTARDFLDDTDEYIGKSPQYLKMHVLMAEMHSRKANAKLQRILAQGVRVWGPYITYSGIAGWFNKQSDEDTHQGIVINIEELK